MTLIAIATRPGRVEFMTDTVSYSYNVSALGHATKFLTLPHLDAAALGQGDADFTDAARFAILCEANAAATFDALTDAAPEFLGAVWDSSPKSALAYDSTVFLTGYSGRRSRFVAYAFASEAAFRPIDLGPMFVTPSPWTMRPSDLELNRITKPRPGQAGLAAEHVATWTDRPKPLRPGSVDDWRELAEAVRVQRALESFHRVIVAGRAHLTRLERGSVSTSTIHEFNDHGEEFLRLIAWTSHPQAQVVACHCGSGKRFLDCHLAPHLDKACWCGSGQSFRGCCMVQTSTTSTIVGAE